MWAGDGFIGRCRPAFGEGFDKETIWAGAGSLSFWWFLLILVVSRCWFPDGFLPSRPHSRVCLFVAVSLSVTSPWSPEAHFSCMRSGAVNLFGPELVKSAGIAKHLGYRCRDPSCRTTPLR